MSYGDPDLEQKWSQMRVIQDTARMIDEAAYPNDPDVPGLTFLSPVEWAPWMETIWFGNQYEYRSAYFHDVMYSNNKPFREGALLYSDQRKAQEMALLYQRYKKFDTDSYSLPNATFFNVFGAETLRVGRYKVPQGDEVILCTTDPLTFTEMKRYFNSFAPIKWFRSKFMQQKRKRQFIMNIGSDGDGSNVGMLVGGGREAGSFFSACVHEIEHGRWEDSDKKDKYRKGRKIPVQPIGSSSLTFAADRHGRGGMSMPTSVANSQYFVESLIQNVLEYTLKEMGADSLLNLDVYMGGDGRLLNSFMMELSLRVMAGNGVKRVRLAKRGSLTTSEAIAALENRKSDNQGRSSLALVWTASDREGGLRGNVGTADSTPETWCEARASCCRREWLERDLGPDEYLLRGQYGVNASPSNYLSRGEVLVLWDECTLVLALAQAPRLSAERVRLPCAEDFSGQDRLLLYHRLPQWRWGGRDEASAQGVGPGPPERVNK